MLAPAIALGALALLLYTYVGYPILVAIFARLSPFRASACMRAREEAVSAVSLPEKKNEASRQTMIAAIEKISKEVMANI